MKILYDLTATQPLGTVKFHGGSEYAKAIFYEILNKKDNQIIEAFLDNRREVDEATIKLCQDNNIIIHYISSKGDIQTVINDGKYDVFYASLPYEYYYLKLDENVKFIYTIHGLRNLEMPWDKYEIKYCKNLRFVLKALGKRIFTKRYLERGKKNFKSIFDITKNRIIIASSYHSKYSIINNFPEFTSEDVKVLYCPSKNVINSTSEKKEILNKYNVKIEKYLLLISADRWIKNNYRAIKAIDDLISDGHEELKDIKTLVLGVKDKKVYNFIKNKDNFIFKDYTPDGELEVLYANAYCFIYPTLNEGFGYPPIECMSYKTPVIASAISSVTEICGDAALYFNPFDISEIKNRILQVFDPMVKEQYEKKLVERYNVISGVQSEMLTKIGHLILEGNNI